MELLTLGEVIKRRREGLGLSQKELCAGVCNISTLSRLETGKQIAAHGTAKLLLQRLGIPDDRYYALLTEEEMALEALEEEAVRRNVAFERADEAERPAARTAALEQLARLEAAAGEEDHLSRQFVLRSRVLLGREEGRYPIEKSVPMLLEALRLTSPGFDLERIERGLYTDTEIKIINQIGQEYIFAGKNKEAIGVLSQLLRYAQAHTENQTPAQMRIPMICCNYAIALSREGRYRDVKAVVSLGIQVSVNSRYYMHVPGLLACQGEALYMCGDEAASASAYRQAYDLYLLVGDNWNRKVVAAEAKRYLDLDLS